jgi:KDEL-tailed cysteine endopeptidase
VATLEAQLFRKTNRLVALSEQNLLDCDNIDAGCEGGWPENAYEYIIKAGGINTMASYPV